jgi:hypothetical protein
MGILMPDHYQNEGGLLGFFDNIAAQYSKWKEMEQQTGRTGEDLMGVFDRGRGAIAGNEPAASYDEAAELSGINEPTANELAEVSRVGQGQAQYAPGGFLGNHLANLLYPAAKGAGQALGIGGPFGNDASTSDASLTNMILSQMGNTDRNRSEGGMFGKILGGLLDAAQKRGDTLRGVEQPAVNENDSSFGFPPLPKGLADEQGFAHSKPNDGPVDPNEKMDRTPYGAAPQQGLIEILSQLSRDQDFTRQGHPGFIRG